MIPSLNTNPCTVKSKPTKTIALVGNPNVGKSTVFNALTGLHQHTGNWPGKTVGCARGKYTYQSIQYEIIDLPGVYSLVPHSAEEEVTRDFLCHHNTDAVVIVCDATCLVRNMNLVLQILELTTQVILCINLIDEAQRQHISVNAQILSQNLGIPAVLTAAGKKKGLPELLEVIYSVTEGLTKTQPYKVRYRPEIEAAISQLEPILDQLTPETVNSRPAALWLLDSYTAPNSLFPNLSVQDLDTLQEEVSTARKKISSFSFHDAVIADIFQTAEEICNKAVTPQKDTLPKTQLCFDRFLTNRLTGIPCMLILLSMVLWITISGANYPSALLSDLLFSLEKPLSDLITAFGTPTVLHNLLVFGIYRVVAWVVSVMLPPMAIFFPLFTLLEDWGLLPRIAFNLDHAFKKCRACGKQALTMCMGFGCNAVGVTGCRIIDSPRERLLAIITNSFVPCNGRFPTMITIITMFFAGSSIYSSAASAFFLTLIILLGILLTLGFSRLLSKTLLRGLPSAFTLELPPYRHPHIGKILLRSALDRMLFVLGRAVSVAAPAGLVIYLMTNLTIGEATVLSHCTNALDPFGKLLGMDGVLIMAFILGLPANEIVLPIAVMAYMSGSTLIEFESLISLKDVLLQNGWTPLTAVCTLLFSLLHWPCSTTLISIKKETGSLKWTFLAFLLPTVIGITLCFCLASGARLFGFA